MSSETLRPDGQLSCSGLVTCDFLEHDEDPDVSSVTIDATGNNTHTEFGVDFPTPSGDPTVGADLQEFRAGVIEFDSGQTGTPTARIELWENGALVRAGTDVNVSVYAVLAFTWNANELATADGNLVQMKVIGTKSGGSPGSRNTVRIGHMEWNAEVTAASASGSGAQTLPDYTQSGSGGQTFTVVGVQALSDYLQSGDGVMQPSATGIQVLADYIQAGASVEIFTAAGAQALADYLQTGAATHSDVKTATGVQALADYLQSGEGIMNPSVAGDQLLAAIVQAGSGTMFILGEGSQILASLLQSGAGLMVPSGAGAQALADLLQAGSGNSVLDVSGAGASILSAYAQAGVGVEIFVSGAAQALLGFTQEAICGIRLNSISASTLAAYVQNGSGVQVFIGAAAQTLAALAQAGTGVVVYSGPVFVDEFLALLGNLDISIKAAPQVILTLG